MLKDVSHTDNERLPRGTVLSSVNKGFQTIVSIEKNAKRLQNAEAEVLSSNKIKQNNKIPHERVIERCEM
ncbi:hypothetical protein TYRP_009857, partial [Tyrophagus putrescentiae]